MVLLILILILVLVFFHAEYSSVASLRFLLAGGFGLNLSKNRRPSVVSRTGRFAALELTRKECISLLLLFVAVSHLKFMKGKGLCELIKVLRRNKERSRNDRLI
ncbi:hypothetical protein NC653_002026 [Populus alba x Populus x berolinensis]|uniref:Secreted protein n=1 Tax=Populus alba x Populus x berolinensis TaxID=444605 RepID=A0AAD6WIN0_9ROSI|nr:hypothetical protein NC653_002026 [Populus alba x Populus x berolinensis]